MGVYKTEQVLGLPDPPDKGQESGLKLPDELVKNATEPNGLVGEVVLVSLTDTAHFVDWPTTTGEPHDRVVVVACIATVCSTAAD